MKHHVQFGHVSFQRLRLMAKAGIIPKRLANCPIPVCSACCYAKAIRRQWRSKTAENKGEVEKPTKPGQVASVDQLMSPTPGLMAQMQGILTTEWCKCATVFIDQHSRLSHVHMQKGTSAEETLEAKAAFEAYAKARGINMQAHHADNGAFKAKAWVRHCYLSGQDLTFSGVGAHHQNGMAERRI